MRIALDAMGGDNAPDAAVQGGVAAARELDVEVALVGMPDAIQRALAPLGPPPGGISIVPAADVIAMEEHGATAARHKRNASINVGLREVKEGRAIAFVSAGNTGAVMAGSIMVLGRMKGIDRPALGARLPVSGGRQVLLLDAGANAEAKAQYLVQFAEMGNAYAHRAWGVPSPRVALLSIGEEEGKGTSLVQDAYKELSNRGSLNFIGNAEGKDIVRGLNASKPPY